MRARLLTALLIAALASPAQAQFGLLRKPRTVGIPKDLPPHEAEIWPYPYPDPQSWWDDKRAKAPEASDPLGGRRLRRGERLPAIGNGIDASTYRLWGLMPLQWQLVTGDEAILEVWLRPSGSVRQSVVRITARRDGQAFVQARAGIACCEAGIARRVGFDAELPSGQGRVFQALRGHPVWAAPRDVRVDEGGGVSEGVCVDGASYDLTLLTAAGSRTLRRACAYEEVGQVADVLEPVLRAAVGHEPRFDVLFPGGVDFSKARAAYQALIRGGGGLRADNPGRSAPPGLEPMPQPEDAPPPPADAAPQPAGGSSIPNP